MKFFRRRREEPRKTELRCSFCHKKQRDVVKLVAGPGVQICNECVAICRDLVAEDEKAHLAHATTATCMLCDAERAATELVHVPNRGAVCFVCVAAIKVAAGAGWEFRADA